METYCSNCGTLLSESVNFCSKCGAPKKFESKQSVREHTWAWILAPLFFGFIGGIIAYFAVKEDSRREANQYLIIGIIMSVIGFFAWIFTFAAIASSMRHF